MSKGTQCRKFQNCLFLHHAGFQEHQMAHFLRTFAYKNNNDNSLNIVYILFIMHKRTRLLYVVLGLIVLGPD